MAKKGATSRIVHGGADRVRRATKPDVVKEVTMKYADEMGRSGWVRRVFLRLRIHREIRKELDRRAPSEGLY